MLHDGITFRGTMASHQVLSSHSFSILILPLLLCLELLGLMLLSLMCWSLQLVLLVSQTSQLDFDGIIEEYFPGTLLCFFIEFLIVFGMNFFNIILLDIQIWSWALKCSCFDCHMIWGYWIVIMCTLLNSHWGLLTFWYFLSQFPRFIIITFFQHLLI